MSATITATITTANDNTQRVKLDVMENPVPRSILQQTIYSLFMLAADNPVTEIHISVHNDIPFRETGSTKPASHSLDN